MVNVHKITALLERGSDDPLTTDEVLKEAYPTREAIGRIKQGKGRDDDLIRVFEFIYVGWVMCEHVKNHTRTGITLIQRREINIKEGVDLMVPYIKRVFGRKKKTARGVELKAIDRAFSTTSELMETLPRWIYTQSIASLKDLDKSAREKSLKQRKEND